MTLKTIAIIGHGRFGRLLQDILPQIFAGSTIIVLPRGSQWGVLSKADLVIPAVPIRAFEGVIKSIASYINPHSIVMDVCSVKVFPKKIMKNTLPQTIQIIASHPMFGPGTLENTNGSLTGLNMVLDPVRIDATMFEDIVSCLKKSGLQVITMDSDMHDRYAAEFHFTAQFIASILKDLDIPKTPIDTKSVSFLHAFTSIVKSDSIELLQDMMTFNPYCQAQLQKINKTTSHITSLIEQI